MSKLLIVVFLIVGSIVHAQEDEVMKLEFSTMKSYSRNNGDWVIENTYKGNTRIHILSPFLSYYNNYVKIWINDKDVIIYRVLTDYKMNSDTHEFRAVNVGDVTGPMESSWFILSFTNDTFTVGEGSGKFVFNN